MSGKYKIGDDVIPHLMTFSQLQGGSPALQIQQRY